ncbi:hypothetical protein ACTG9Q_32685 [Actinokineospora sp. 24-640]
MSGVHVQPQSITIADHATDRRSTAPEMENRAAAAVRAQGDTGDVYLGDAP